MHLHVIADIHMKSDVTGVQKIIGKILFDHIALIAAANNKVINPK
jgi:hypothetical protein